jgi:two-component system, chemotaxis family, chemotaxis protein CheY
MAYDVLIVDDSQTMRALVTKSLELSGLDLHGIHEAEDGRAALVVLGRQWVDVVLADVHMPGMSGIELLQAMHADPHMESIPCIIISSDTNPAHLKQLRELGAKAFLRKPFRPESLRKVLLSVLAGEEGNAP